MIFEFDSLEVTINENARRNFKRYPKSSKQPVHVGQKVSSRLKSSKSDLKFKQFK